MEYNILKKMKKMELIEMILEEKKFVCLGKNDTLKCLREINIDYSQENFILLCFDSSNKIIKKKVLFKGSTDRATVDLKILFREILTTKCVTSILIAHNHPSGNMSPSRSDKNITENIIENSNLFGIRFLDHLIFDKRNYFSFLEEGLLN